MLMKDSFRNGRMHDKITSNLLHYSRLEWIDMRVCNMWYIKGNNALADICFHLGESDRLIIMRILF